MASPEESASSATTFVLNLKPSKKRKLPTFSSSAPSDAHFQPSATPADARAESSGGSIAPRAAEPVASSPAKVAEPTPQTSNNNKVNEEEKAEETVKPSRKNPEHRPKIRPSFSVIRELRDAPTEETRGSSSTHVLSRNDTFESLGLCTAIAAHALKPSTEGGLGFQVPTSVQSKAIPSLLAGQDALIRSETGSGKTLAFVLPILHSMVANNSRVSRSDGMYAVVLSPTRELCTQIFDVLTACAKPFPWIVCSAVVGGEKKKSEKARLRKGVNILVATPGRLADHLRTTESIRASLRYRPLRWLILDEGDRLMDAGFEKQIEEILGAIKTLREEHEKTKGDFNAPPTQTVLLSATISQGVERLAGMGLRAPVARIENTEPRSFSASETLRSVKKFDDSGAEIVATAAEAAAETPDRYLAPKQLVQHYMSVESRDRLPAVAAFVRRHVRRTGNTSKVILFVAARACAEFLHGALSNVVWPPPGSEWADQQQHQNPAAAPAPEVLPGLGTKWFLLHGSMDHTKRKHTLKDFAGCRGGVLICTDVAARGLDLPLIDLVLQYDPPNEVQEYIHRVGRTARQGRHGTAVLFLRTSELEYVKTLKDKGLSLSPIKTSYDSLVPTKLGIVNDREVTARAAFELQKAFEDLVESDAAGLKEAARAGFAAYISAYAVHSSETKHIFIPRALHLGHVARSFGLKEPPTKISKLNVEEVQHQKAKAEAEVLAKRKEEASQLKKRARSSDEHGFVKPSRLKRADASRSEFAA